MSSVGSVLCCIFNWFFFLRVTCRVHQFCWNCQQLTDSCLQSLEWPSFWPKIQRPSFRNCLKFGYKYGTSSHFVLNLMLLRNNTDWVEVSCKRLACCWLCWPSYQIGHFTSKTWPQSPNFKRFVKVSRWFFGEKMVNLNSGRNNPYVKVPGRDISKNWSTLMSVNYY